MSSWNIGLKTGFAKNPGKYGKYYQRYLEPERWELFERTYPDADYEHIWQGLFAMGQLFRSAAQEVALHFGYTYPLADDEKVSDFLRSRSGDATKLSQLAQKMLRRRLRVSHT